MANGRSVTCESTGAKNIFFPLRASAHPVVAKSTPVPVKTPSKAPAIAPTKKVTTPVAKSPVALPAGCSSWSRPPLQDTSRSFRASVVREVKSAVRNYVVNVGRSFKGCEIKANDRVLVSLSAAQPMPLITGNNYLFVGLSTDQLFQPLTLDEKAMLGNRTKVKVAVHLGAYNRPFEWQCVNPTDATILRTTKKVCP
jgi:hypothetical protein